MAKITTLFGVLLFVSFAFVVFGTFIGDIETNYIETGISDALPNNNSYTETFDLTTELNDSLGDLTIKLQEQENEDTNLIGDLFRGGMFLVSALFSVPFLIFDVLSYGITLITIAGVDILGIPQGIIFTAVVGLIVWGSFKLVSYARRYEA